MVTLLKITFISVIFVSVTAHASEFEGMWIKPCVHGVKRMEFVQGNTAELDEDFHTDDNCLVPGIRLISQGTFISPSANDVDFTFEKVLVLPRSEAAVADLNSRAVCGETDWQLEEKEVTGKKCALFGAGLEVKIPERGRIIYGIWRVEKNKLYLGKLTRERDGSIPEKRPTEFDSIPYLKY